MKLPRWLVVSLLTVSAFAVLGYGAWWWVTWPEQIHGGANVNGSANFV
jgi:hypothetical protein